MIYLEVTPEEWIDQYPNLEKVFYWRKVYNCDPKGIKAFRTSRSAGFILNPQDGCTKSFYVRTVKDDLAKKLVTLTKEK